MKFFEKFPKSKGIHDSAAGSCRPCWRRRRGPWACAPSASAGSPGKHENEIVDLVDRVAAHAIGQALLAQVGHIHALAAAVVGPAVVVALELVLAHHPQMQGHLAMRAAVLQGVGLTVPAAVQDDGLAGKTARQGLARLEFIGPGQGIPEVRVGADAPQVKRLGGVGGRRRPAGSRHLRASITP